MSGEAFFFKDRLLYSEDVFDDLCLPLVIKSCNKRGKLGGNELKIFKVLGSLKTRKKLGLVRLSMALRKLEPAICKKVKKRGRTVYVAPFYISGVGSVKVGTRWFVFGLHCVDVDTIYKEVLRLERGERTLSVIKKEELYEFAFKNKKNLKYL